MSPKEKAKELFNKYWDLLAMHNVLHRRLFTKYCAIIAVENILNVVNDIWMDSFTTGESENKFYNYWKQVKEELEKL